MAGPSDSASNLYAQLPMSNTAAHIRVLHLLPGFRHQRIKTTLETVNLFDEPYFEALSYTWGASHLGRTIQINGAQAFAVTDNLFNTLRRLRSAFVTRVLWIDQLCINQDDTGERSRQVAIMADIYSRASAVNVWLGEPGWTLPLTLGFRWPTKSAIRSWSARDYWLWFWTVRNRPQMIDSAISASTPCWHDRVWTVQEFVVARKTYFCYGSVRALYKFGDLDNMWTNCSESQRSQLKAFTALNMRVSYELSTLHYQLYRGGSPDFTYGAMLAHSVANEYDRTAFGLLDLKIRVGPKGASDQRDQVYSVLGLLNADEAKLIGIDYSLPCSAVYAKATFASIRARENFDIFVLLHTKRRSSELPSWCVDFSRQTNNMQFTSRSLRSLMHSNVRDTSTTSSRTLDIHLDDSCRILSLPAVAVDRVLQIVPIHRGDSVLTPASLDDLCSLLQAAVTIMQESRQAGDGHHGAQWPLIGLFMKLKLKTAPYSREAHLAQLTEDLTWAQPSVGEGVLSGIVTRIFQNWTFLAGLWPFGSREEQPWSPGYGLAVMQAVQHHISYDGGSAIFVTTSGMIGLAPDGVCAGDEIVRVRSCCPFIALRRSGTSHAYKGQVMIHGLWGAHFLEAFEALNLPQQQYSLC